MKKILLGITILTFSTIFNHANCGFTKTNKSSIGTIKDTNTFIIPANGIYTGKITLKNNSATPVTIKSYRSYTNQNTGLTSWTLLKTYTMQPNAQITTSYHSGLARGNPEHKLTLPLGGNVKIISIDWTNGAGIPDTLKMWK